MKGILPLVLLVTLGLSACGSGSPTPVASALTVDYSFAAASWENDLAACSASTPLVSELRAADTFDPSADLSLRLGTPNGLNTPAYQVGTETILVVVGRSAGLGPLTLQQAADLFSGRVTDWAQLQPGKAGTVQPWVFPAGEDVEQLFEAAVLGGAPVSSQARLANTPDEMSAALASDPNAIGLLPGHWKTGNLTTLLTAASVPVLALTPAQPKAGVNALIACLQTK